MIITIDGPAGSGKSTVARAVAEKLGWMFLDTGAMYRAVALRVIRAGVDPDRIDQVVELARTADLGFARREVQLRVFLNGEDVTDAIRTETVSQVASRISAISRVRTALVEQQRQLGAKYGRVVTEGRDQGSVVFPDAELKVYLDADVTERARRRYRQLTEQGQPAEYEQILAAVKERDRRDQTRTASPLVVPPGAVVIDSTSMTAQEVINKILQLARSYRAGESLPRPEGR